MRVPMRQLFFWFALCCISYMNADLPLKKRPAPIHVTTSIVVPCVPIHFQYIPELLEGYTRQTVLPDEVVISLSEGLKVNRMEMADVKDRSWPFKLLIIENEDKTSEGTNRNIGTDHSSGDVLLYQDADDLPHPQRVEIVKYLFENYFVQHVYHGYILENNAETEPFAIYDLHALNAFYAYQHVYQVNGRNLHNGAVCFTRDVANKVRWVEGFRISTDSEFSLQVYKIIQDKVVLIDPLILYRYHLSTYHGINKS